MEPGIDIHPNPNTSSVLLDCQVERVLLTHILVPLVFTTECEQRPLGEDVCTIIFITSSFSPIFKCGHSQQVWTLLSLEMVELHIVQTGSFEGYEYLCLVYLVSYIDFSGSLFLLEKPANSSVWDSWIRSQHARRWRFRRYHIPAKIAGLQAGLKEF